MKPRKSQSQLRTEHEIERAIKLLSRAAERLEPYGRLRFELHWEPNKSPIEGSIRKTEGQTHE